MKSRTSSFNPTVFKKDLTRFAPAWAVYLIILLLGLVTMMSENHAYYRITYIEDAVTIMSWINLIYAAVVAQLLFGDLYNSRLCNALHAMPITRDGWFATHTLSGLAYSVVPNLVICLLALPMLRLGDGRAAIGLWLGNVTLQYLFFFGTAVLCVMLSGSRLGQLAVYTVIQFAGLLAYWLASRFYEPLLHGIILSEDPFSYFCPLMRIAQYPETMVIDYLRLEDAMGGFQGFRIFGVTAGEGWGYTAICAGLGILALMVARQLYRKRNLECAGDFVAFSPLEPVMTVVVTIFAGGFFHLCGDVFGMSFRYVLMGAGMVVGYFGCRMLLERTTRVFRKKTFLGFGALMAVFALTLVLTYLDPVGITRYQPSAEEVKSVTFSQSHTAYRHGDYPFVATEAEDIETLMAVHADCIAKEADQPVELTDATYSTFTIRLEYTLENGKTVDRFYTVHPQSEAGQILKGYFTRPECVLGFPADEIDGLENCIYSLYVDGYYETRNLDLKGLLEAIVADCDAGNMARLSGYHYPNNYDYLGYPETEIDGVSAYLEIGWDVKMLQAAGLDMSRSVSNVYYSTINIYSSCENTLRWMDENGLLETLQKELPVLVE